MNISSRIANLISGYLLEELNDKELQELVEWTNASTEHMEIFESVLDESSLVNQGRLYANANVNLALSRTKQQLKFVESSEIKDRKIEPLWIRIAIVASVVLICTVGGYYLNNSRNAVSSTNLAKQNEINPGSNKATLTLANGKKIVLSEAKKGELAHEAGVVITKAANGMLVYEIKAQNEQDNHRMNTLSTANGEQYQVSLPDGTKVWLNAATSLRYPASFGLTKERRVELNGEAYFEVAKDKTHPFIVTTNRQSVEVLGTHFNVNSYSDETITKTTLLEGAVKINDFVVLKPGEEGVLAKSGTLTVRKADTEGAVAWKNGLFVFENESLKTAMNKIARWYNVEVQFQDRSLELLGVGGSISRFDKISEILRLFEKAGDIQFTIKGRTIIINNRPN
ncbi:FecR family protein [Pedobacter nutrimenti]|uniref:FecR family protein n=1 Tax=Pedobacter nutrimenti TaxID=1241337 RepID=UPI00292E816B|nr:FecR domain-containing protein [Pedobacter nutrimenti]